MHFDSGGKLLGGKKVISIFFGGGVRNSYIMVLKIIPKV